MFSPTRDGQALQAELTAMMSAWDGEEAQGVSAFRKGRLQWSQGLTSVTPAGEFGVDEMRGLQKRLGVGTPEEAESALRKRQEAEVESVRDRFEDVSRVAARFETTAEMGIEDGRFANSKYAWIAVDVNKRHLMSPHKGATMYHDASRMLEAVRPEVPSRHTVTPEGYRRIDWSAAEPDQAVWLVGWESSAPGSGEVIAYGPFTVVDPDARRLRSAPGRMFMHYPEDLLVEDA